jgi:LemA protein
MLAAFTVLTAFMPLDLRAQPSGLDNSPNGAEPAFGECWRLNGGRWQQVPGNVLRSVCIGELYSGGCAGPNKFYYGRWGGQTLRLTDGRVEVSSNDRDFTTLVDPWPACRGASSTQPMSAAVSPEAPVPLALPASLATPDPAPPSADFQRGQQDRRDFEAWFHGLTGDYLQGAAFWTGNRSRANHAGCDGSGIPGVTSAWTAGCMAAEQRLTPSDQLRHTSTVYRQGWNSIPADPGDYNAGIPVAAQSQSAFNDAPSQPSSPGDAAAAPPSSPAPRPSLPSAQPVGAGFAFVLMALLLLIILVLGVIFTASWVIPLYNRLVILRETVRRGFADMDVLLKQRHDLIPNIVETVRGYASHENATLQTVVSLRSAAVGSGDINEKIAAESSLSSALGKVFALAENYPDLKANTNFLSQQKSLLDIESWISEKRIAYNKIVSEFNAAVLVFPAVLVAGTLGFRSFEFFDIGADQRSEFNNSKSVHNLTSGLKA